MPKWELETYEGPEDLLVAVIVKAVRDCVELDSSHRAAYEAYDFLMDDFPWEIIGVSCGCRDMIRELLEDPACSPSGDGYVQEIMEMFRDP